MKGLSLFSNVGIAETYLKECGINIVVANELLEERAKFYKHLYPDCTMISGDITNDKTRKEIIELSKRNNIEFVIATPPCQGMSIAGHNSIYDERNSLIKYAVDVILKVEPKYVLLENVTQQLVTPIIYKNRECISSLSLKVPEIDFGNCYQKIKKDFNIDDNIIIAIVEKINDKSNYYQMISFSMHNPIDGNNLPTYDSCKNEKLLIKQSIKEKMNNTNVDIDSLVDLYEQNIDIFNLSSIFYTDICFHYSSKFNKDIALKDRILIFFPNIVISKLLR